MTRTLTRPALFLAALTTASPLLAATVNVSSLDQLQSAIAHSHPGDRIVLADGTYTSPAPITIDKPGTADHPLIIEAKTVGGVEITGAAGFRLEAPAAYVVLRGFVFTHHAGTASLGAGVHHCRITRNVFAEKLNHDQRGTFLDVLGDDNEIDHNTFRDKDTEGQMLFVQGPTGDTVAKRTWVHHNYFLNFKNTHKNNASGLHIGSSGRSMDSARSVVEYNLFVRNVGENEGAICNKSSDNIYRYNTIVDSTELSLRHGHRVQVYGNFLLNSDGLRFFAHDHQIYSNYFENCRPAITIGNGDGLIPPAPLTCHQRPDRVKIVYNTLVNNRINVQMTARKTGALGANDLTFANNLIVGGPKALSIAGPLANPTFANNLLWSTTPGDLPPGSFTTTDPALTQDAHHVYHLSEHSPAIAKGAGTYPFVQTDLDAQPRPATMLDIGADQFSTAPVTNHPLTASEVGPSAPADGDRPLLSAPSNVHWIQGAPSHE